MPVRMKDIAVSLGLSQTTVSHVLAGREAEFRIGARTADRVRAAAKRMRYQPSALARNLKHHRAYTLALAVGDLANPFWASIAVAAQKEAERHGYMLAVNHTGESAGKERQLLEMLRQRRVDGLILSPAHLDASDLAPLRTDNRPIVLIDRTVPGIDLPAVVTDNIAGMRLAVNHLVARRHSSIGFLGGPADISTFRDRLTGFRNSMRAHGLSARSIETSEVDPSAARDATLRLLNSKSRPTAIIAANIWLTFGALRAVPHDVEVVGFDDIALADLLRRPLSTIAHPVEELGREAVRLLMQEIAAPGGHDLVVLEPRLIVR